MRVGFFLRAWIATKVNHLVSKHYDIKERLRFKREFVSRDQVFPLIAVNCLLLQLKNKYFHASFIRKNCSGLFLSAYFLF